MNGLESITQTFEQTQGGRARFMPYFPVGFPDYAASLDILEGLAGAGADLIEIGIPFSDPIADGPTVQAASQIALQNGTTLAMCVEAVAELRQRGVTIPLLLMGYLNPMLAYGLERFMRDSQTAGVNGYIVPDLPPDEAADFHALVVQYGMALPLLLAPTSNETRIRLAGQMARGFLYLVSVTGVTGARQQIPVDLPTFIARVRQFAPQPLAVGFGISTPEQAQQVSTMAEGVIIGSRLITLAQEGGAEAVIHFAQGVRAALEAR